MKRQITITICVMFLLTSSIIGQNTDVWKRPLQTERERTFDVIHYKLNLSFDLDRKSLIGSNSIVFKPLLSNFSQINLDATELVVTEVRNSSDHQLKFIQNDSLVTIYLLRAYASNEKVEITVFYKGQNLTDGLYFHDATDQYPKMVESNSWPNHARYWYPCYDSPNDKATQEVIATVKKPYKVISNGALLDVIENGDSLTYHWYQTKPHSTYLSMLSIAEFSIIEDSLGSLPINYWVFPGDEENAKRIFSKTPEMIQFFNTIYGYKYPWDKYDQVIGPRQGGGAEATSATILGMGAIHDKDIDKDLNWERIIAHEIAHQWWGDLITLRTWSETWMNEGFGTYSDYLYTEAFRDKDEASLDLDRKKKAYLREANTKYKRPIVFKRYNQPQDNFDSHTYPKAASVLHMLRSLIGEEAFFKSLKHFLHKHEFGSVDTHDFKTALKEATGMNLDWFIDQWIYNPGHPVFNISKSWDEPTGVLRVTVKQVQDTINGVPVFKLPLRVGLYSIGKEPVYKDFWINKRMEVLEWNLENKPQMVRFDVNNVLLKEWTYKKDIDELIYQIENDDVIGSLWAIGQLEEVTDTRSNKRIGMLMESLVKNHTAWAVRLAALQYLNKKDGKINNRILNTAIADDHHKVRSEALKIKNGDK